MTIRETSVWKEMVQPQMTCVPCVYKSRQRWFRANIHKMEDDTATHNAASLWADWERMNQDMRRVMNGICGMDKVDDVKTGNSFASWKKKTENTRDSKRW